MVVAKISQHEVSPNSAYFFDTNIWLFIFGPVASTNKRKQSIYSQLLKNILSRNAVVFVSSLVLSEYVNAVLHIGFNHWKTATGNVNANFKHDFRNTPEYLNSLEDAIQEVGEILRVCQKRPDDFHIVDITTILSSMSQMADYNDSYYLHDCEKMGMKLVSDDADMRSIQSNIMLITA